MVRISVVIGCKWSDTNNTHNVGGEIMAKEITNNDNTLLTMRRGNKITFNFALTDGTTALDLTGSTIYFIVKNHFLDPDDEAEVNKSNSTHDDPTAGLTSIPLVHDDTIELIIDKLYYYEFALVFPDGEPLTIAAGNYKVSFNVKD